MQAMLMNINEVNVKSEYLIVPNGTNSQGLITKSASGIVRIVNTPEKR